ncbi:sulfite exporter TauE/SafE family protein, partial [Psychromonas aquimarina]|uniref:sulfite exporter TauE/SafE family protein n=1 Tax=Psychromonas aquimarina TaxID=444919 RepID=UPI00048B7DA9
MFTVIDPTTLLLASVIIFLGSLTQSLIGFGLAVIASPLLYIVDPQLVPVPVILMGFSIALLTLFRERRELKFDGMQYALLGRIPGGFIGVALLMLAPQPVLGLAIAVIVGLTVILSFLKFNVSINRLSLFIAGILSGIFANIAAIGGPPIAILLAGKEANQFRAALSAFFIISSLISLAILAAAGFLNTTQLQLSLMLLPSMLLGYLVSGKLVQRINKEQIKT